MNKIFTLALLILTASAFAQPTLLSSELAPFGNTYFYKHVGTFTAIDTNQQGANQTWDFSSVLITSDPDFTVSIFDPAQSVHGIQFPNANWGTLEGPLMDYNFFVNSSTQLERVGGYNMTDGYFMYDNTQIEYVFPFTYPQSWSDSSNIIGNLFPTYLQVDNIGFGTVVVPGYTYTNVIMSRAVLESFIPIVQYVWYSSDDGQPVFAYVPETFFTPEVGVYLYNISTGIEEKDFANNIIFNNPFTSSLNLAFASGMAVGINYELINSMGKIIRSGKIEKSTFHKFSIEMQNESAGLYVLTITDTENPARIKSLKVIKQ